MRRCEKKVDHWEVWQNFAWLHLKMQRKEQDLIYFNFNLKCKQKVGCRFTLKWERTFQVSKFNKPVESPSMPRPKSPVDWLMTWSNVNVTTHELPPFRNTSTIFKLIHNNLQWCLLKNATNQEVYMELPSRKMKEFLKETEIEQLVGPCRISCSLCFQYPPSFPQLFLFQNIS